MTTIVALGDSTTAGTPGFQSPIEAPPDGRGNVQSQYSYWLEIVSGQESGVGSQNLSVVGSQSEAGGQAAASSRSSTTDYGLPRLSTTDSRLPTVHSWLVLNRGVNGERTDQIHARFERDVLSAKPNAVVIIAGVNDVYQGRGADAVMRELEAMYDIARAAKIPLVAGTILPFNTATPDQNARMRTVNDWIRQYASRSESAGAVVFCDTRAAVAAPDRKSPRSGAVMDVLVSSPDNLHPSPDGYRLMAIALEPAIRRALALGTKQASA